MRYLSPEQAGLIDGEVNERSDLYSAGAVLFECLAGRPLFAGDTITEVLRQQLSARPPVLRSLGVAVPRALDEVIQRLLHKDPRDRYHSAEGALADLAAIDEALARGDSEPVIVVGARDQRPTLTEPAFVGRSGELATLVGAVEQARRGQGRLVLLEAESGGGKTRLLDELASRTGASAWVLRGQGVAAQAPRPFQMLDGVAQQLIEAAARDPARAQAIRERIGDQADAACAALPELAPVLEPRDPEKLGPEAFGETRSVHALAGLLDALGDAGQPALVILDDCQWADEATLKLLRHWQDRRRPARGRGPRRAGGLASAPRRWAPDHPLRHIEGAARVALPPLEAADVRQLAESMAGPLPEEALTVVEELRRRQPVHGRGRAARAGRERGAGARRRSLARWRPRRWPTCARRGRRAAFLARRLELLPGEVLELLSVGAVLGKEFDLDLAAELAGQTPAQARLALAEARRRHMVWARPPGARCVFVHDKLREALLDRLSPDSRAALHRRAAARAGGTRRGARASSSPTTSTPPASRSAPCPTPCRPGPGPGRSTRWRWPSSSTASPPAAARPTPRPRCGCRWPRGWATCSPCGALRGGRGRVRRGRAAWPTATSSGPGSRASWATWPSSAATWSSRPRRSSAACACCGGRCPAGRWACSCMLQEVLVQALHTLLPRLFVGRRPPETARAEEELLAIRLYSRLAYVYWFGRGKVACAWAHLREMNLAERYPPTPELAQAYSEHAPVMTMVPWFGRGIAYAEKSLAIRRELGDLWGQGQSLHFYGVVLYGASRYEACIEKCREAIRLLERTGDRWEVNTATWHIAFCHYRLGEPAHAPATLAERLYADGAAIGDAQAAGISLGVWAKASGGQVPAELIEAELERRTGDVATTAEVLQAEALRLLRLDRPAEAVAVLERADGIACAGGFRQEYVAPIRPWLATALRTQLEATPALAPAAAATAAAPAGAARCAAALRLARAYRNNLPHALREAGLLAAMRGRGPSGRGALLNQSMELAGRRGAATSWPRPCWRAGGWASCTGWSGAAEDLRRARELLSSMELRGGEPGRALTPGPVTLSLADRFDQIMDRGRQLASALTREAVSESVRTAALALLRGSGRSSWTSRRRRAARPQVRLGEWPQGCPRCRPSCWNGR